MLKINNLRATIVILFVAAVCMSFTTQEEAIVGNWHVSHIVFEDSQESGQKYLNFTAKGEIKNGKIGEEPTKFGTWKYDANTKIIELTDESSSNPVVNYVVKSVDEATMVLADSRMEIHLVKQK